MAAVALTVAPTWTTAAGAKTSTATPVLGDLIVVIAAASGITTNLGVSDNNSDGNGTYTFIKGASSLAGTVTIQAFVRAAFIGSATSTIWTTSGDGASTGGGLGVYRISGLTALTLTGISAIRQSAVQTNGGATATPSFSFSAAALTGNPLIGGVVNGSNAATLTPPTGWTEDADLGYNTPATGLEIVHINSGFTGSSLTWGSTSATTFAALALEIHTANPSVPGRVVSQAVSRAASRCWAQRPKSSILVPRIWTPDAPLTI